MSYLPLCKYWMSFKCWEYSVLQRERKQNKRQLLICLSLCIFDIFPFDNFIYVCFPQAGPDFFQLVPIDLTCSDKRFICFYLQVTQEMDTILQLLLPLTRGQSESNVMDQQEDLPAILQRLKGVAQTLSPASSPQVRARTGKQQWKAALLVQIQRGKDELNAFF